MYWTRLCTPFIGISAKGQFVQADSDSGSSREGELYRRSDEVEFYKEGAEAAVCCLHLDWRVRVVRHQPTPELIQKKRTTHE